MNPETPPNPAPSPPDDAPKSFEELSREKEPGLIAEFWMFIKENKIWWMLPIVLVLSLLAVVAYLAGTGAMPFIYTLF